jgi:teichuronic acid biosynthesis glycosyltransferase TuaC
MLKILHITNMYPFSPGSYFGIFVKRQIDSLSKSVEQKVISLAKASGGYAKIFSLGGEVSWADILHCHFGHTGSLALFWKFKKKKPLIVSYCGSDLLNNKGLKEAAITNLNSLLSKYVDCAIVRTVELSKKVRAKRIRLIPSGVDVGIFRQMEQTEARKAIGLGNYTGKIILFLGQKNNRVKNFPLFKKALEDLDFKFKFMLLEGIAYDRVAYYMNAADVCVMTSHYEGSPNAIKEAMSCNRPIVSVEVGDVRELLGGIHGCSVVNSSPAQIAGAIKKASEYKQTNGRQRIFDQGLDLDATAGKIIKVYKEIYNQ